MARRTAGDTPVAPPPCALSSRPLLGMSLGPPWPVSGGSRVQAWQGEAASGAGCTGATSGTLPPRPILGSWPEHGEESWDGTCLRWHPAEAYPEDRMRVALQKVLRWQKPQRLSRASPCHACLWPPGHRGGQANPGRTEGECAGNPRNIHCRSRLWVPSCQPWLLVLGSIR